MEKYKLHEDIKILSENVYMPNNLNNGWQLVKDVPNSDTGFQGAIYKNNNIYLNSNFKTGKFI